jgi:hypothetical protein
MKQYDYYIGLDWSQAKMALAISQKGSDESRIVELDSDVRRLKYLLKSLKGTKILTLEESTASQWLWVELHDYTDEIIVCDPYHNFLLSSGPKNDRIDASKLLELLRGGLLKPVFHSSADFMQYRSLLGTYTDLVKTGVAWKNRLGAQQRARAGENAGSEEEVFCGAVAEYIIEYYEIFKKSFEDRFRESVKKSKVMSSLTRIPGIGVIGAFKIGAIVVDASRFKTKGHFLSYCGLIKHKKMSGGRSYGNRSPRCNRTLKSVFKTAAFSCAYGRGENSMKDYFNSLIAKGKPVHAARHMVARKIATTALAIMKSGKQYNAKEVRKFIGGREVNLVGKESRA